MAYIKPVQYVCPKCKKGFTRMQGDVLTPFDMNPYCGRCSLKNMGAFAKKIGKVFKPTGK